MCSSDLRTAGASAIMSFRVPFNWETMENEASEKDERKCTGRRVTALQVTLHITIVLCYDMIFINRVRSASWGAG